MLRRLPQAQRTWLKFRGGAYSGANLFLLGGPRSADGDRAVAFERAGSQEGLAAAVQRSASSDFLGAALRLRTLEQTLDAVGRKLGLTIRAVELSRPAGGDRRRQAGGP